MEIGRKCSLASVAGFTFGTGIMSACFHIDSNLCSSKEELIILQIGFTSITAYVLHNQFGIPSGPLAFRGLILLSRLHVSSYVNSKVSRSGANSPLLNGFLDTGSYSRMGCKMASFILFAISSGLP